MATTCHRWTTADVDITLASTKTPFPTIYLFRLALLLCQSNTEMLRHVSKVSESFALRAAAHSAKSVCQFAAQGAANRASLDSLPFGEEEDRTSQVRAPGSQGPIGVSVNGGSAISFYKHSVSRKRACIQLGAVKTHVGKTQDNETSCAVQRSPLRSTSGKACQSRGFSWVLANPSLNRTHCGMRLKARHFILGL